MPILNTAAKLLVKPVPKMISPKAHAVIDYMTIGSFVTSRRMVLAAQQACRAGRPDLRRRRACGQPADRLSRRYEEGDQLSYAWRNRSRTRRDDSHHA